MYLLAYFQSFYILPENGASWGELGRVGAATDPVLRGGHEHEVGPKQLVDQRQRDGGGLVDTHKLGLAKLAGVRRVDVLQPAASLELTLAYPRA